MLQYKINFNDINWEEPFEGVKCKIFKHGDKQLRLVVYSKEMPIHWCEKDIMDTSLMARLKLNTRMKR